MYVYMPAYMYLCVCVIILNYNIDNGKLEDMPVFLIVTDSMYFLIPHGYTTCIF